MKRLIIAFAILFAVATDANELARGISTFTSNLYQQCAKSTSGNVIVSPFSVTNALALLSQATDGNTLQEIKRGLHFNGDKSAIASEFQAHYGLLKTGAGKANLSIVNQIYVQQGHEINKNFGQVAVEKFRSGVESVNFAKNVETAAIINHFVEEKTNGRIKKLFTPEALSADSRVVLVNAVHFKGDWETKFYESETYKGKFYTSQTDSVDVDFMNIDTYFKYASLPDLDATALQMKYADSELSMIFILPNSRTGLSALEDKLKNYDLGSVTDKMQERKVEVSIPKFTVEFETNLNDALKNLGMGEMFSDNADLSGLLQSGESLKVSDVVHKAFITVYEGGSEAAAATGLRIIPLSLELNMPKFLADHNFMYYIWDNKSKTTIFIGRLTNF
ncbi:antichymotrypsin-2-like [Sitodiplosis mosellana]|uniref:antichymotrypsin-2-like n=1 Tax=Sitodiplosis mosellana TaxID=263140 RepID=UPI0024441BEC|nr:antichymotrypsin-2-like [Sitodiplosis mosellana]